ncbi:MAG: hypothetical protein FJ030_14685 [Chloroflexi bacterium]|nr:hypothetical protein [Chloroflexota bacterium]
MHGTGERTEGTGARRRKPSPRKRTETPITAEDALQILQSALHYCHKAQMKLLLSDGNEGTTIHVAGCHVVMGEDGQARLVMNELTNI